MSTNYFLYLEAKLEDGWHCIDGYYNHKDYSGKERLALSMMYENGSYSYFGDTYDQLRYIGTQIKFSDLSPELQEEYKDCKYKTLCPNTEQTETYYTTVPIDVFQSNIPKGFQHHSVVHKDQLAAYKCGDIEDLWQEDDLDLSKLSPLEQKCYEYVEWDDKQSWQYWFKKLDQIISFEIAKYLRMNWKDEGAEFRMVIFVF